MCEPTKTLDLECYTLGDETYYYLRKGDDIYEISNLDQTVRIMSLEAYQKITTFYHQNDDSGHYKKKVSYYNVKETLEDDSHEDYYVFNTPYDLLKEGCPMV